jgi:arylsulfatase A-like enzyme
MQELKELKLEENTLVIFTTDHGVALPRAKGSLYDPGVQVALLLRYPGRQGWHGGVVPQPLVSNMDLLPSIMELIGVERPVNLHGQSFLPLLDGGAYEPRTEIFFEITYHDYYDPRRSIRTATHKLIANFTTAPAFMDPSQCWRPRSDTIVPENHATAYHPHLELYDLTADPNEQADLAGKPEHALLQKDLACRLLQHMAQTHDPILQGAVTSPQHLTTAALLKGA